MERQDSHKGVLLVLSPQTSEFLSNQADSGPPQSYFPRRNGQGMLTSPINCVQSLRGHVQQPRLRELCSSFVSICVLRI